MNPRTQRTMPVTKSIDGIKRGMINIQHRIDREEAVRALAIAIYSKMAIFEEINTMTSALRVIRDEYTTHGIGIDYLDTKNMSGPDDICFEGTLSYSQAEEIVDRFFNF